VPVASIPASARPVNGIFQLSGSVQTAKVASLSRGVGRLQQGAAATEWKTPQGERALDAGAAPLQAGLLHALLDDDFARSLDGVRANGPVRLTRLAAAQAPAVVERPCKWQHSIGHHDSRYA
jgi:hypothetical protein